MDWQAIGKVLLLFGVILIVLGGVCLLLAKLNFSGLPGDISFKKGNVTVFFPIVSCIVISIVLTVILNLLFRR